MPVTVNAAERPGVAHCLTPTAQGHSCAGLEGGQFKGLGWVGDPELQRYGPP